jgi:hypothetical protein
MTGQTVIAATGAAPPAPRRNRRAFDNGNWSRVSAEDGAVVRRDAGLLVERVECRKPGKGREIGRNGLEEFLEVKSLVMRVRRTRTPWVKAP